jgi:hypothetical protein
MALRSTGQRLDELVAGITDIFTSMTQIQPTARCTAQEAHERFLRLRKRLPRKVLARAPRVTPHTTSSLSHFNQEQTQSGRNENKSAEEQEADVRKFLSAQARRMRRTDRLQRQAKTATVYLW